MAAFSGAPPPVYSWVIWKSPRENPLDLSARHFRTRLDTILLPEETDSPTLGLENGS
jgi:hypothetical protein